MNKGSSVAMNINKLKSYGYQSTALGLAFIFTAAAASGADIKQSSDKTMSYLKAHNSNTKIVKGDAPQELGQNRVSFIIDISNFGFFEKLAYSSGQWPLSAILFNGNKHNKNRLCPYFELSSRPYQIDQIKAGKMKFLVQTTATPDEIKTIEQYGCIVTETPSTSDINFKSSHRSTPGPRHS